MSWQRKLENKKNDLVDIEFLTESDIRLLQENYKVDLGYENSRFATSKEALQSVDGDQSILISDVLNIVGERNDGSGDWLSINIYKNGSIDTTLEYDCGGVSSETFYMVDNQDQFDEVLEKILSQLNVN